MNFANYVIPIFSLIPFQLGPIKVVYQIPGWPFSSPHEIPGLFSFQVILTETLIFVIPHLEMCACDRSKSRHVTFTISGYFPHGAILPPLYVNIASMDQYCLHVQFDFFKQQLEPHSTYKSKSQFFASYVYFSSKYGIILMESVA